jgi:hypothetical protein
MSEYQALPMETIFTPSGRPYLSVIDDGERIAIQSHSYEPKRVLIHMDKKAIPQLVEALEKMYNLDSNGSLPKFNPGERVFVKAAGLEATVIEQMLSWDYPESFWGNVRLKYDDGVEGVAHSWQCTKVVK